MTPEHVALWAMVGTAVAALGSVATAAIALFAAFTWKLGLKAQRTDDCVAAFHDCAAAIGRSISRRATTEHPNWGDVSDAWHAWSRARTAYAVVSTRYFPSAVTPDETDPLGPGCIAPLLRISQQCLSQRHAGFNSCYVATLGSIRGGPTCKHVGTNGRRRGWIGSTWPSPTSDGYLALAGKLTGGCRSHGTKSQRGSAPHRFDL